MYSTVFHLKTNEFFLLLGPNGSTFRELADEVGVTLTQVERTNSGFDLSLKGLCYSLDQLAIMLLKRREVPFQLDLTIRLIYFIFSKSLRKLCRSNSPLSQVTYFPSAKIPCVGYPNTRMLWLKNCRTGWSVSFMSFILSIFH